ncbi:tRNA(Ile)-lysidine synthase [Lachnospiraceae bacterium]|nr:tRNA(Ile)-lysidine synthase [Lachnospiraceae bacterium]
MVNKVLDYVKKYRMIEPEDTIVAGISGGADSVCLLFVLAELQKRIPFAIRVVHVDHGIRQEAAEDACYVRELCRRFDIPFTLVEENVREGAKIRRISEEEEGRRVRYQAFARALEGKKGKIAVAHNSNDRAETMLFHLFRGTGLTGASGIRPVAGNVIRPLLCVQRSEIESWLGERGVPFCTDSTNGQDIYTRNRIRHHILSYAEQEVCRGAVANMNRAADQLLGAEEYIGRQVQAAMERCVLPEAGEGTVAINIPALLREDGYVRGRILLECLARRAGGRKNITAAHVGAMESLFLSGENGEIHLPYGFVVYKKYDLGMIQKKEEKSGNNPLGEKREFQVAPPGEWDIPGLGRVEFTLFSRKESQIIPQKTYTKWFDYDKITSSIAFRTRKQGDYLTVNRKMGRQSLQDYFVNEKVPRQERDGIYLLTEGAHVMWVPGRRISEYYKISEGTRTILQAAVPGKEGRLL